MAEDLNASVFRRVAVGQVAENKALRSRTIRFTSTEILPFLNDEVASNVMPLDYAGLDAQANKYEGSLTTDNTLEATWLPSGSNRVTPPDVRRGERVEIYQSADEDLYYWRAMGLDDNLRRLETLVIAINANASSTNDKALDFDSCYFVEMSSHTGSITLQTSLKNNEKAAYEVHFNTAQGTFQLQDNVGNYLMLDSVQNVWRVQNVLGTYVALDKETLYGYAPKMVSLEAGTQLKANVGGSNINITSGNITIASPTVSVKQG